MKSGSKIIFGKLVLISIFSFIAFYFSTNFVEAQCPEGDYHCYPFSCYNTTSQQYIYNDFQCNVTEYTVPVYSCDGSLTSSYRTVSSGTHLNTNPFPSWPSQCGSIPAGCNQGFYGSNTPTCSGGGGGGGQGDCCPNECSAGSPACQAAATQAPPPAGICPALYLGTSCSNVPCGYRDECSCTGCLDSCDPQCTPGCGTGGTCGGGGGGEGGPTPTPAPSCDLSCPGELLSNLSGNSVTDNNSGIGSLGGANVKGATTILAQSNVGSGSNSVGGDTLQCGSISQIESKDNSDTTYGFGIIEDTLDFVGYNGFNCISLYSCPLSGQPEPCPSPTIIQNANDTGIADAGSVTAVLGAASDSPMFNNTPIGEVLGVISDIILGSSTPELAQTDINSSTYYTSTWSKNVTLNRLNGNEPAVYGYQAVGQSGASCSCQVILGCQESLQASPNDPINESGDCEFQCDFTVNETTEYPDVTTSILFDVEANDGFDANVTIDFDDGNGPQPLAGPYPAQTQTLLNNAGVYDVTLSCSNNGNHTKTCTRRLNVYCDDPTALPTPTPTPPGAWIKVKDTSFHSKDAFNNPVPAGAVAFDNTDTGVCDDTNPTSIECFNIGEAGNVTVSNTTSEFGTAVSDREWLTQDSGYATNNLINPSTFIEYARARKDVNDIDEVTAATVQTNIINIYDSGNVVITDNTIPDSLPAGEPAIIVVDGNLTIDMTTQAGIFNASNNAIAFLVTGTLSISSETTEMNGIFVANSIDFAYDVTPYTENTLKVNGNITAMGSLLQTCADKRQRQDNLFQPSCFFTFDFANQFLPMMHLLSVRTYDWTELVP